MMNPLKRLGQAELQWLCREAARVPRRRTHQLWHLDHADGVQRLAMALQPGTYVRPHRHADPPKWEALVLLTGKVSLLTFDDEGRVLERLELSHADGAVVIETPAGTWHSLVAIERDSTLFELKQGPFAPSEFAGWAPAEDSPRAPEMVAWLAAALPGDRAARSQVG
jgi:cupin fold WbuC family metalloprotein